MAVRSSEGLGSSSAVRPDDTKMLAKRPVCSGSPPGEEAAICVDESCRSVGRGFFSECRQGSVFVEVIRQHSLRVRKLVRKFSAPVRSVPARPQSLLLKYEAKMFFANCLKAEQTNGSVTNRSLLRNFKAMRLATKASKARFGTVVVAFDGVNDVGPGALGHFCCLTFELRREHRDGAWPARRMMT